MNPHERWFDGVARNLIRHAARRTPPALAERLEEEWLADLAARAGAWSQLRFALGCSWATTVIAHEFAAPMRAAAATAGGKSTVVHDPGMGPAFSRRTTVILLIIGLHVLVIVGLATAIVGPKVLRADPPRIVGSVLPSPPPHAPPMPVDPTLKSPPIVDPPVPEAPRVPAEPTRAIQGDAGDRLPVPPAGPPLPRPVSRVAGGPGAGFPDADDFYPQASIRQREAGVATVGVCVDGAGRLIGRPSIDLSSGIARLDEAALKLAQAGSGHYRATTEDGRPVSACYPFRVRFRLRD
jgi:protein TonB